jgi:hypothetical protein
VVPTGKLLPDACDEEIVTEQLSETDGVIQETFALHALGKASTEIFEGQLEITGSVTSLTVTLNEQVEMFP